jgi:sulfatase modifying factor 1
VTSPCCSPNREPSVGSAPTTLTNATAAHPSGDSLVVIDGGPFLMGSDDERFPADREGPVRSVDVTSFSIGQHPVTNAEFAAFVQATGTVTLAETDGWSFVFAGLLPDDFPETRGVVGAPWWRAVEGADWCHPFGPQSSRDGLDDHPVVHVNWFEASAYAAWVGARLPTEAEWEKAARGGLVQARYPWGDELQPAGAHRCNIWQGNFPTRNTGEDGWIGTSPVGSYPPNGYGLVDVAGNVWEWTADWFDERCQQRAMRGGSYLCHESYCNRYRVGARSSNTPDTPTGNIGFRIARDRTEPERTVGDDQAPA